MGRLISRLRGMYLSFRSPEAAGNHDGAKSQIRPGANNERERRAWPYLASEGKFSARCGHPVTTRPEPSRVHT